MTGIPDIENGADLESVPPEEIRGRIIRLGFGGDATRYAQFVQALREVIPDDVTVILRGSAVTGKRWADGAPFDADGPGTSDIDLTFIGGEMLKLFTEFYIPGLHTVPLTEECPQVSPVFAPLRRALCTLARRPVNIQATSSLVQYLRDVVMDQPYYTLLPEEDAAAGAAGPPGNGTP